VKRVVVSGDSINAVLKLAIDTTRKRP
jgi:hypothetical protein